MDQYDEGMGIVDGFLALGASLRLTRLVTSDLMGGWYIKDPIDAAMDRYEVRHPSGPEPWWWKMRTGLDCPFCVGFWLGAVTLSAEAMTRGRPRLHSLWKYGASALAMNYVAGHINARLDSEDDEEPEDDE